MVSSSAGRKVSRGELREALRRSGYLLESRVDTVLRTHKYAVSANQVCLDPITGKAREFDILNARVRHSGNRLARWCVDNVSILENSAGERKPDKKRSSEKIDPVVARVLAVGRAALNREEPSVYTTRGILVL